MYIYSYHQLARDKVNRIKLGYRLMRKLKVSRPLSKKS